MNEDTHKTVRVEATMHTSLYMYINVPIDTDDDTVWQYIRDGNIDGGSMIEEEGYMSGGWTWEDPHCDWDFEENAKDVSEEIKDYE